MMEEYEILKWRRGFNCDDCQVRVQHYLYLFLVKWKNHLKSINPNYQTKAHTK